MLISLKNLGFVIAALRIIQKHPQVVTTKQKLISKLFFFQDSTANKSMERTKIDSEAKFKRQQGQHHFTKINVI